MAHSSLLSISSIFSFFNEERTIKKAENSVSSGNVNKVQFDDELGIIRGEVQASMKNRFYKVEIYLTDINIERCTCTCPRGLDVCHHMAALALSAHYNLSRTDKGCSWLKKIGVDEVLTAEKCFSTTDIKYSPLAEEVSENAVAELFEELSLLGSTSIYWLMSPEPTISSVYVVPDVQQIIFSEEYVKAEDKTNFIVTNLELQLDKVAHISNITTGQRENPQWLIARRHRLTASNFGRIIKACKLSRFPPSLFKTLTGSYNLDGIKQIQWGQVNEKVAIQKFQQQFEVEVKNTGLHLHVCGYLGASPDGLVGESCIVEVKCPYKYRNEKFIVALKNNKNYAAQYDDKTNTFTINKNHDYYHQVQGQLHILKREKCFLILYSTVDLLVLEVLKDENWSPNINLLQRFYLEQYVNHILS